MSAEMNLFVITGRVARVHKGERMCKVTLVTSEMRWDKDKGEEVSKPTYHNVTFFSDAMGLVTSQEINEGDTVSCTGTIRYRRIDPDGSLGEKYKWVEEATLMGASLTVAREKGGSRREERRDDRPSNGPPGSRNDQPSRGPSKSDGPPRKKETWPYTDKFKLVWSAPDSEGNSYIRNGHITTCAMWLDATRPEKGCTYYVDSGQGWQETDDPDCPL